MRKILIFILGLALLCSCASVNDDINMNRLTWITMDHLATAYYQADTNCNTRMILLDGLPWRYSKEDNCHEYNEYKLPPFKSIKDPIITNGTIGYELYINNDTLPPYTEIEAPRLWKIKNNTIYNDYGAMVIGGALNYAVPRFVKPYIVPLWSKDYLKNVNFRMINVVAACAMFRNNFLPDIIIYRLDGKELKGKKLKKLLRANLRKVKYIMDKEGNKFLIDVTTRDGLLHRKNI